MKAWCSNKLETLPIQIIDGDRSVRYPKRDEFQEDGFLFLNTTNIDGNRLVLDRANFVSAEKYEEIRKGRLRRFDVVMTTRGSIGKVALFNCSHPTGLINAQMLILRADGQVINPRFLFYLLSSDSFQRTLKNFASGSAQPQIPIQDLRAIEVTYPPVSTQRTIAAILSAYDDLIENNTRRIRILEEVAQAIYREWFVHFRFPGHKKVNLVNSPLGLIPERWEVATVAEVCSSLQDGDWVETKDQGGSDYRLLQVSNVGVSEFIETGNYRYVTNDTFKRLRCTEVMPGDVLISRMPKPTGRAWLVTPMPWRMITAVDVAIAKPDKGRVDPLYLVHQLNSSENLRLVEKHQTGTTRPRISRSNLGALRMVVPPLSLQVHFGRFTSQGYELITSLRQKNRVSQETRDLLLPKLISGEVDVSDLDINVGDAAA